MDRFVRRLVERLVDEGRPLSRNRHFHTFETPEGRTALRMARRLRALSRAITRCVEEGGTLSLHAHPGHGASRAHELCLAQKVGTHRAFLSKEEVELLRALPGLCLALGPATGARRTG
jgi:hypothetical protein